MLGCERGPPRRALGLSGLWLALALGGCRADGLAAAAGGVRVVSLHDVTTEIVVALGATDRLVGAMRPVEVPAQVVRALTAVAQVDGAESIVKVRPTLVLGTDVVAERSPELVAFLRGRGVEVYLASPTRLQDVFETVLAVAARVGVPDRGRALVSELKQRAAAVRPPAGEPLPVFVYDCCDPAFTAAGKAVLSDLIARAGGRNVFADLDADWTEVSWEAVIGGRPRLVLIHAYDFAGQGDVASKRARVRSIQALADLPDAVLPLGLALGGIRSVEALERLAPIIAQVAGR